MRLLIVGDSSSPCSTWLVDAAARAARRHGGVEVVALVEAARTPRRAVPAGLRQLAAALVRRLFDATRPLELPRAAFSDLRAVARRLALPLLGAPGVDLNSEPAAAELRGARADAVLVLLCAQVFGRPLLDAFACAVNCHNGLLPAYRGLHATAWSVYHGEAETGFSFHRMTAAVDEGAVLASGAVPIVAGASVAKLQWAKARLAASRFDEVLEAMLAGEPGRPQSGPAAYYSAAMRRQLLAIEDPTALDWDELARRLRAFTMITLTLGGERHAVTRLRRLDGRPPHRPRLAFVTRDGVAAEPDRFIHLPYPLYRAYRPFRRRE